MYPSQEYLKAMVADREREIRKTAGINDARRARNEARRAAPERKWGLRIRRPQQA